MSTQAITIYIDMHGSDNIHDRLINPGDGFTHTFVSTIGKLGCFNMHKMNYLDDTKFCEKINKYRDIFQGKTICESNKFLSESIVDNIFEDTEKNQGVLHRLKEIYPNDADDCALKYHQGYISSANKSRVLTHERTYSCCYEDPDEPPIKIEFEERYMGIFVIETYNMRNPIINEIFDELKSTESNCRPLNLCRYLIIKHIYGTLEDKLDEFPELDITSMLDNIDSFDLLFHPLLNETEFEILHKEKGTDPIPEYDDSVHSFSEIYHYDLDTINNYKIKEINLSEILRLFFILGFEHVNIIDDSCREIIHEYVGNYPTFMKPGDHPHKLIRSISTGEKTRARDFFFVNPELGGKKSKNKKKRRKSKKSRKRKNRKSRKSRRSIH